MSATITIPSKPNPLTSTTTSVQAKIQQPKQQYTPPPDSYGPSTSSTYQPVGGNSLQPGTQGATQLDAVLTAVITAALGQSPQAQAAISAINNALLGSSSSSGDTTTTTSNDTTVPGSGTSQVQGTGGDTSVANPTEDGSTASGPSSAGGVSGSSSTKDGYTLQNCKDDMKKLAQQQGGHVPAEPMYTQVAQGIIDGINANFSGKNLIGDYSKVSGATMAKALIASAFKESQFGQAGNTPGGVYQTTQGRLDQYNQHNGTHYSLAQITNDAALSVKVGLWAMANPYTIVGVQAGNDPIPSSLPEKALYYWNYNPVADDIGHGDQLADYVSKTKQFQTILGSSIS